MRYFRLMLIALVLLCLAWGPIITLTVGSDWTDICGEARTSLYPNVSFKVKNTGTNPFTACQVETWVGPGADDWEPILAPWVKCASLIADDLAVMRLKNSSYEKVRVRAKSTLGSKAYCRPYGNGK